MTGTTHERVGDQSVLHRRSFAAPPALVQRAHLDPDLFVRWLGPRGTAVRLVRFDATTGGAFRYAVTAGADAWMFTGSYHEVVPGRIVHTWQLEGEPDVTLETLEFRDAPGGSELVVTSTHRSAAACTAMLDSGLDDEMEVNFSRLDEVLAAL